MNSNFGLWNHEMGNIKLLLDVGASQVPSIQCE